MPITDKDVADLCLGIYAYPGSPPVTWDRFDDGEDSDQICWGVKIIDGCDILVFRGSATFEDWRRDFDVWANPFVHSKIGPVHPGFLLGLDQVLAEYRQKGSGKLWVAIRSAPLAPRSSAGLRSWPGSSRLGASCSASRVPDFGRSLT